VTPAYTRPEPLRDDHVLDGFECRSSEQTLWLRRYAHQSVAVGTTRVFVVTEVNSLAVVAYYGWCMAQLHASDAPPRLRKGGGRYPQPVALLARLGVDVNHEGRGLGAGLVQDVFLRLLVLSKDARDFYRHLVPEFEDSPTDPLHLVLLMKDIRRTLAH
jgi:GNAT superfamily N-acetyltransferase